MVIQKSFERQHFRFETSNVVEFIATHKDLHSLVLVFEIIARIDCLWILYLLLQGDEIDADW
jgi:hypothetical protein